MIYLHCWWTITYGRVSNSKTKRLFSGEVFNNNCCFQTYRQLRLWMEKYFKYSKLFPSQIFFLYSSFLQPHNCFFPLYKYFQLLYLLQPFQIECKCLTNTISIAWLCNMSSICDMLSRAWFSMRIVQCKDVEEKCKSWAHSGVGIHWPMWISIKRIQLCSQKSNSLHVSPLDFKLTLLFLHLQNGPYAFLSIKLSIWDFSSVKVPMAFD